MSYFTNRIRAGQTHNGNRTQRLTGWISVCLGLLFTLAMGSQTALAQLPTLPATPTTCDYATEPASLSLTAQNVPAGYSTIYLLVNMTSGMIMQTNATEPVFSSVTRGLYYAVAAHYKGTLSNAQQGKLISEVYSSDLCLTYGPALGLKVCAPGCDYATAPASITFTANNVPGGVSTAYALVNTATNLITQTSTTASFAAVPVGEYAITSVHYTGSLTALVAGNSLYSVTTENENCLSVSNTLYITVCNSPIAITGPLDGTTVASLNPPISGTSSPGASVTVTGSPGSTGGPCITTANASGVWSCSNITFPAGPASVTATDGTTTAVSNFTTTSPTSPPDLIVNGPSNTTTTTTPTVSGTATPGSAIVITGPGPTTLCTTTASASGTYACALTTPLPAGPNTLTVTATGPGGSTSVPVTFTTVAPPTIAIISPAENGTATTTPTISGTATPLASVTVLGPNSQSCVTTASASGTYACPSLTFAAGPQSVTATVSNPGGTATDVNDFTAVGPPSLTVTSPNGVSTTTTPTIAGTATPGSAIAITDPSGATVCTTTASASGTYACALTTPLPEGPTTLTVTATTPGGSTSVPVTFTTVAPPTIAILSPAENGTATTTPTISGTATPLASVTVLGPNSQSCVTTASASGTFACSNLIFGDGPQSVTATVSTPGGTASDVNTFTAVGPTTPASLTVAPTGPQTTTAPVISGTATPGSQIAITDPSGATLCATTASASGTFSCSVTVPVGPNTLTVTACTTGGCSTTTTNFTAIAPPTIAILSPTDGSTATTSPTVSGTATPLASVTVSAPGNTPVVLTTDASGNWSTTALTFPTGPNTVTATVSNPGGTATDVNDFTVVGPPSLTVTSPNGVSTTTTPTIAGTATPGSAIAITDPSGATVCTTTASASGTYACALTTPLPEGPTTLTVTATTPGGSTSVPVTFTTVAPPTITILSPADGSTATTTPTISGTATPLASVTVLAPGGQSCVTTASVSGTYACSSLTFAAGPQSVTATVSTPGGTATDVNTFTAVAPCLGTSTSIISTVCGTLTPVVTGGTAPYTYTWNGPTMAVTVGDKDATHPYFGVGSTMGFSIDGIQGKELTLVRGVTYSFNVNTPGHPFAFTNSPVGGFANTAQDITLGVTNSGATSGIVTFTPSATTPSLIYYNCDVHANMGWKVNIVDQQPNGVLASAMSGTYSLTVTDSGNCSSTATAMATACPPTLAVTSPINVTTTTTPTIAGTATPGSVIAITDPAGTTLCTTTASASGTFACALTSPLPAGPTTLTVTATGPGGSTSVPVTFTTVAPASLTVAPTGPQTTTAPVISGTATPGSQIAITDPSGATLCATTASASGTFSCSVTVSVGPNTLTVTACTTGGCSTTTTNFTAIAPPTIAILSPADGSTATTTPTISGTATPLASVTVLGPNSQSCVTTASASGTYACSSLTFAAGPQSVTATVSNPGGTATDVNAFTVVPPVANQSPEVTPDFNDVVAGIPATGNVLTNDKDPEGSPLTATTVGTPPAGFTLSPDGSYTYTAPIGTTAPVTVPIQVCDGSTPPACTTTTLTLIPVPVANPATNDAPIANPDTPKTTAGVPVVIAVLANDVDPEGTPLSNPVIVTQPTHGTAVVNPDGTVSYTPTAGYTGTDQLTYSVCDGGTPPLCGTALVSFTIDPTPPVGVTNTAPVALDDALLTQKGVSTTGTVAANDSDPDGQPLVFAKLSDPINGTVVFSSTGSYTYVPAPGFVGADAFTYQVCDNASPVLCTTATVHLTVQPTTAGILPPVATSDIANTNVNVPATGNVLNNDTDPQGGQLTASVTTQPTAGTVTMSPDGTYSYTPPTDFTGTVSFCYSASNSAGLSASACVSVNVNPIPSTGNDKPIANNDNTQTTAGTSVTIVVLANDTDPDSATTLSGQLANPTIVSQPSVGTAVVNPDGTVTFTPPTGFTGVVSFPYSVCDKATPALCATAVVIVEVQPTPPVGTTLAPVAIDDALLVSINTPKTGDVSANDSDPNTPALPLVFTTGQPASGTVVMSPTGSYTYTPAPGYTGPDSFIYLACNSAGKCDVATVSINVQPAANQAPVVTPDFNDVVAGIPATGNVLTNDKDPEGSPLTATTVGTPPAGFTLSPDGSYTYTAPIGTTAPVTVPIQVCDGATPPACATTTLTLVPVPPASTTNDAPIANVDTPKTTAGVPVTVNVVANDVDPEGQPLTVSPILVSAPTHGTAVVNPDGTVSYTPTAGYTGPDQLVYKVCDGGTPPLCGTALVSFTIDPTPPVGVTNTAPVALDDALLTQKGVSTTGTVAANDSDPEGQPLVFAKLSDPINGTVVFSSTGSYTYVPAPGFVGADAFTYQVCDNASPVLCTTATVHLTVQPVVSGPPVVTPDIANTSPGKPVSGNVLTNDSDPQGLPLTASVTTQPIAGTVTMSPDGSYTYTSPVGFTGTVSFCYTATNTSGSSASTCVTINVNPDPSPLANNAPIANNDNTQTTADTSVTVVVLANDTDPDSATSLNGQLSNPTIVSQPSVGTAVVNANGSITFTPPTGFTGVVTFPYSVCDKATPALCATAVVSVDVQPTPPVGTTLAPVAVDDALLTQVNVPKTGTVAANDNDPQGLPLTYTTGQPTSGTVVMSPTGSYTYTPAPGYVGPTSFTYSVCNSAGKCDVATVSVEVQAPVNQVPVVTPDVNTFIPGVPTAGNVLANDKDLEGTLLTATTVGTSPVGFTLSPDGSYTYTSPSSQTAPVTVPIQVCDGATPPACATTVLTLTPTPNPTPANDAPVALNDATRTTAGVSTTVNVLGNDKDPEGLPLTVSPVLVSAPTHGTAVVNPDGTISYTPTGSFTGVDQLTYQVCDSGSPVVCSTAVVTFTVDPTPPASATNLAPVAIDDQLLTTKGASATGTLAANDSDPNAGQLLTFTKSSNPTNGSVVVSPTGSYTYVPAAGFVGTDHFTYQVCDTGSPVLCTTATVYITVNAPVNLPPVVVPDFNDVVAGVPATGNVLTNDKDPEGSPLTATTVGTPPAGFTLSPDGSYTYTAPVGMTASVTVPIQVCDGSTPPACSTTTLMLIPVPVANPATNDAPIANPDTPKTTAGTSVTVAVLANDVDPEGAPLSNPVIVTQPTHGTAVVNPDGTVSYTPTAGYTGTDQLTYSVCDGGTPPACATALVSFTIDPTPPVGVTNTAPVALDDALLTQKGISTTGTVSANDSDPQGQPLTFAKLSDPANGTVVFSSTGSYTYVPAPGFVGADAFTYQVCDNASPVLCTTATVHLTVQPAANQAPVVTPDFNDVVAGIPATGNVLTNDKDPEGSPLTATTVGTPPAGFTLSPDGSYTYTAPIGTTAPVTVPIQVCDGATPPACATTTLTLVPVPPASTTNDAPIANVDTPKTTAGVPVMVNVVANDVDPEGQPLTVSPILVSAPTHGTAVVNPDGTVSYTPAAGYTGPDQLVYKVCDGGTPPLCGTALVSFTIDPTPPVGVTNTAPVALDDALLTQKGISNTGTVAANDSDPQGQPLVFAKLSDPANGTVVFSSTGSYTYVPAPGFVGADVFTYQVCDNASPVLCTTATVHLTVQLPAGQPPVITPDIANTSPGKPVSGNVLTNDSDPQGLPLTASVTTQPTAGTVTMSPDGSYTYTSPVGFTGTVSFCYTATNAAGLSGSSCVSINVEPDPVLNGNDRPIPNNDATQTTVGITVTIAILANDTDPDAESPNSATTLNGQLDAPTLVSQPSVGTAVMNVNGTVTYSPPAGFTGVVTFPYQICDKATTPLCATALVTVTILPTPPANTTLAPVAIDDALLTQINTPKTGTVATNDTDPAGLPLTYATGQPKSGTVIMSPTGSYTYIPTAGYNGGDSFTYSVCNSAGQCDIATVSVLVQQVIDPNAVVLRLKVMLQGALIGGTGGLMRDDLRSQQFLPLTEPYSTIGGARFTHVNGGGETMPASVTALNVGTGDAVVDWVFVELRDPSNLSLVVATRSAMVQRDGDVVLASDGVSPLSFTGLPGSSFYVSVKHRNHLGVMTATSIPLSATGTIVDFTSSNSAQVWNKVVGVFNYEGWEQTTVSGKQALWAGDANHNGKVKYQGSANDLITIFSEVIAAQGINNTNPLYNYNNALGYYFGDVNMDGKVKYQGTSNDTSLIFTNVITNFQTSTQMNSAQLYNFDFMLEQLP